MTGYTREMASNALISQRLARARRRRRANERADAALSGALQDAGLRFDKNTVDRITAGLLEREHDVKRIRKGL